MGKSGWLPPAGLANFGQGLHCRLKGWGHIFSTGQRSRAKGLAVPFAQSEPNTQKVGCLGPVLVQDALRTVGARRPSAMPACAFSRHGRRLAAAPAGFFRKSGARRTRPPALAVNRSGIRLGLRSLRSPAVNLPARPVRAQQCQLSGRAESGRQSRQTGQAARRSAGLSRHLLQVSLEASSSACR